MDTNEHNEKELMKFSTGSRVPELLMSSVFDDEDVHWFAAGNNDTTWLEITKSAGRYDIQPWQLTDTDAGPVKKSMAPSQFVAAASYDAMRYNNDDASAGFYQYALHLAILAAKDACDRGDRATAQTIVQTLRPHIPWLGHLLDRAVDLHGPEKAMKKLDDALHASGAWEMGDTKHITNGPVQPYVRTAVLMALLAQSTSEQTTAVHALHGPDGACAAYLWVRPSDEENGRIVFLLSPSMEPLLATIEDPDTQMSSIYTAAWTDTGDCWELPYQEPLVQTLTGWKQSMSAHPLHPGAWFEKVLASSPRALNNDELQAAVQTWTVSGHFDAWAHSGATDELFQLSQWLVQSWGEKNPDLKYVLDGLVPPMEFSEDLASVEETRLAIGQLHRMQNTPAIPTVPLPDLDATAPVVP